MSIDYNEGFHAGLRSCQIQMQEKINDLKQQLTVEVNRNTALLDINLRLHGDLIKLQKVTEKLPLTQAKLYEKETSRDNVTLDFRTHVLHCQQCQQPVRQEMLACHCDACEEKFLYSQCSSVSQSTLGKFNLTDPPSTPYKLMLIQELLREILRLCEPEPTYNVPCVYRALTSSSNTVIGNQTKSNSQGIMITISLELVKRIKEICNE